jgi:hypothetical protein
MLSEATRPITGMDYRQRAIYARRFKLEPAARTECYILDARIPRLESTEHSATSSDLPAIQSDLFQLRKRFRELRC